MKDVRETYPAGVPCWVDTDRPDPAAAREFYGGLFGWKFEDRMPEGSEMSYHAATIDDLAVAGIGSRPEGADGPVAWNSYFAVDSADDAAARAKDAGGAVVMEPFDVLEDGRMAVLADPEGAGFSVWEAKGFPGARLVNHAGAWGFNELNTRDVEGAARFYGELFGWELSSFEMEGMPFSMMRMPGYGEFLERLRPGLGEQMADQEAPDGFIDAVAWVIPMDQSGVPAEVPAHWSVSFGAEDVDEIAARAEQLGGSLAAPPFDAGPTRTTVISDPEGATFSATRYYPPDER